MKMISTTRGASMVELIIQMVTIMVIAPVIVCCIAQSLAMIAAIVLPWLAIIVMVIGVTTCLAAFLVAGGRNRPHLPAAPLDGVGGEGDPVLPIRRPPGLPGPGERREN